MKNLCLLFFMLLLFSCGKSEVEVTGVPEQIDVVHSIDLENLEAAFLNQCIEDFPDDEIAQNICVEERVQQLLDIIQQEGVTE